MVSVDLAEVAEQMKALRAELGRPPYRMWIAPDASHRLMSLMWTQKPHPPVTMLDITRQGPFGLRLDIDHNLPQGVWRLTDEHGTLLYDCRQGQVVP